jgi:hypothetical protein
MHGSLTVDSDEEKRGEKGMRFLQTVAIDT